VISNQPRPVVLRPGPARSATRRSWSRFALGVAVVLASALGFALLTTMSSVGRVQALRVTHRLLPGDTLTARDLALVDVTVPSSVPVVPAGRQRDVLGKRASRELRPGDLLEEGDVGEPTGLVAGEAAVALGLQQGQFPPDIRPGARVRLVLPTTQGPGVAPPSSSSSGSVEGRVLSVEAPSAAGLPTVVVVAVPEDAATGIAAAEAQPGGRVTVVELP
jgi:hypothetical protein